MKAKKLEGEFKSKMISETVTDLKDKIPEVLIWGEISAKKIASSILSNEEIQEFLNTVGTKKNSV